jgi:flagellar hook protein FlgE
MVDWWTVARFLGAAVVSLFSVMQTALTGMAAAEATLGVVADNLANARTDGFKARRIQLVTQTAQTVSQGEGPHGFSGGTNPQQIGAGVQVAGIASDFSQGSVALSSNPSDLALNGEGLFIVEGASGGRLYTRQGALRVNAQQQLVTASGQRVLGYGVDDNFQLNTTELSPLDVPIGRSAAGAGGTAAPLTGYRIGGDGRIRGVFTDGITRDLGQIRVARFANPRGLIARGNSLYAEGISSGLPVEQNPAEAGIGTLIPGATEESNTGVGAELVTSILAENQYRASLLVLETADSLLEELFQRPRP